MGALMTVLASGQTIREHDRLAFGIDLRSLFCGCPNFCMNYSFDKHWSLFADIGLKIARPSSDGTVEEEEHYMEFSPLWSFPNVPEEMCRGRIGLSYWSVKAFKGTFISIAGEYSDRSGWEACCGLGYCIAVWKRLSAEICCNIRIRYLTQVTDDRTGSLGLKLYYRF